MFTFIRYLVLTIFAGVIAASLLSGTYTRNIVEDKILAPLLLERAEALADAFDTLIWKKHATAIHELEGKPPSAWESSEDLILLKKRTSVIISAVQLTQFTLYTPSQVTIYTNTQWSLPFFDDASKVDFRNAVSGTMSYHIIQNVSFKNKQNEDKEGNLLHILIPLKNDAGATEAVLRIVYDISVVDANLSHYHYLFVGIVSAISIICYFLIHILVSRAQAMIAKQSEINKELQEAKARAEHESREKSKFLANVSHELRTPLNAIIGFSDIIKDEVMGPIGNQQYKDYILDINNSGVHLLSLINDILDYSKAEAGKLEVDVVDVDLTKIIKNSMRLVLPRAKEAQVKLIENIPDKHIIMTADPKRIKQVLLNLLSNSVKFTPEQGEVKLSAWERDGKITIEVADTGIGISAKDIAKAMSTFGQVDSSLSRRYEGTGLGLPFSKKLVEMMNGEFHLKSEEGLGTTVTLTFPSRQESGLSTAPAVRM
ncbi:MAG: sensor histidine kinase [Rickettsiales bacterium]|jgi:two-component system cell cycle sensor histidine kinase PleC|nr:sensor histidine kinase [Rickettsiales bacterium]